MLLSIAFIKLYDYNVRVRVVRAVLDSGSTSSLMTERVYQHLNLTTYHVDRSILGIEKASSRVCITCRVTVTSFNNSFCAKHNCFVLPSITSFVPCPISCHEIHIPNLAIPYNICLADPTFYVRAEINIFIGADLFWDLLGTQNIKLEKKKPVLCKTRLGLIISGPIFSIGVTVHHSRDVMCNFNTIDFYENQSLGDIQIDTLLAARRNLPQIL